MTNIQVFLSWCFVIILLPQINPPNTFAENVALSNGNYKTVFSCKNQKFYNLSVIILKLYI